MFRRKTDKSEQKAEEELATVNEPVNEFTEETLKQVWETFRNDRITSGARDAEKLVLSRDMKKDGNNDVCIILASALEENILDRIEQDVVTHLRKELQNFKLLLKKEVQEQETTKKLYTSKDKFEYMAERNPALKEMKERLGLDFEY